MMVNVKHSNGLWRTLVDLLQSQKYWMNAIAADFDITPQMAHALHLIPATDTITMKELAGGMWCDASNATGIVDRLEQRGFVERRNSQHDRRVKCVALTADGKRLRRKLDDRFNDSPPAIAALDDDDRRRLAEILRRALANAAPRREDDDRSGVSNGRAAQR